MRGYSKTKTTRSRNGKLGYQRGGEREGESELVRNSTFEEAGGYNGPRRLKQRVRGGKRGRLCPYGKKDGKRTKTRGSGWGWGRGTPRT